MNTSSSPAHYSLPSRALHWLMALLIIAAYALIELHDFFPRGSTVRRLMVSSHFLAGLTIFWLVWLRIVARLAGATPPVQPAPPAWQQKLAKAAHGLLYVVMIGMPLIGWMMINADDRAVSYFGVTLPNLIGPNEVWHHRLGELHETLGNLGMLLIGGHVAAALYHHHVQKDNTLRLMLPRRD